MYSSSSCFTLLAALGVVSYYVLKMLAILEVVYLIVVLICISPMTNAVECLFHVLICQLYSLVK